MPKVKRTPAEQAAFDLRVAIENRANLKEVSNHSLALTIGVTDRTLRSRKSNPDTFTFGELVALSRRLGGLGITL